MSLRVVFLGSDPIALPLLDWLHANPTVVDVVGVMTQPDRPAGRGQKAMANAIKLWAMERKIPVFQPERLGPGAPTQLAALRPDLSLVMAYGHILRDEFIGVPRLGTVNLHASLLPKYRGASPIQSAIAAGERETGVTLMRIVRELDAGPVADAERVGIASLDTATEIEAKLASACLPLLARTLPSLAKGSLGFAPQDGAQASYCRRLTKADGALNFFEGAGVLAARINALHPWPGCNVSLREIPLKFGLARARTGTAEGAAAGAGIAGNPSRLSPFKDPKDVARGAGIECIAGTVLAGAADALSVGTGQGVLEVLRLQRPGGRMLGAGEFLRGFPIPPGTVLPSVDMPPLISDRPFKH